MKNYLTEEQIKIFLDALEKKMGKKLLLCDMDGVVANFDKAAEIWAAKAGITAEEFKERSMYRQENFFRSLETVEDSVESIKELSKYFEIRFLSAPSWSTPPSFIEKRLWIPEHFGDWAYKRMDYSYRKDLTMGHFLIDDRLKYGTADFIGEHIMFGSEKFKTWKMVVEYLKNKI